MSYSSASTMALASENLKNHVKLFLKNIGQSFFLNNAYFGAIFLLLLMYFDYHLFIYGLLGSLIAYAYTLRSSTQVILKDSGVITINGFFFGIAMASFFQESPVFLFSFLLGAALMPLVVKATFEVLQHWRMSPLIIPYILVVWLICLCGHGPGMELNPSSAWPNSIHHLASSHLEGEIASRIFQAVCLSMSRVLFVSNMNFGFAIFALITLFSPRRGFYFLSGTLLATLVSYALSADSAIWEHGYFSYSAGLIGLGLASFPENFSWQTIFGFCMFSSFLTIASEHYLDSQGLPTLSLPYVITFWLAQLGRTPRVSLSWAPKKLIVQGSKKTEEKVA